MECLNASILKKSHFSSEISLFRPNFPFTNRFRRNPLRNLGANLSFFLQIPFSSSSPFSNGRKLQISAHFGRASKRRNSLRKKLNEEQKVRNEPDFFDSGSNFQNPIYFPDEIEHWESNLNSGNLEESSSRSVEKSKLLQDSVLWSKLENWVDQYKKDAEFWGLGSGPVFTVFEDSNGNVESVSINEDEIMRRSLIEPWPFKREELVGSVMDVNSKISYAKGLAKEIEIGEYKLPRNSSIAKFVVSGKQSGFVNGLRSVIFRPQMLKKLPRIGFVMLCGYFILWSMKKILMVKNDGVELTREEKEMLRRKLKLRMEKEKLESGSVEVLPDVANPLMESIERPQLNKEELMSSILKAKASGETLILPNSSSSLDVKSRTFNDKIQEIQEMARQARELERKDREECEDVNEDLSNELEDSELHGELLVGSLHDPSDGDSVKPMDINVIKESPSVDDPPTVDAGSLLDGSSVHASVKPIDINATKELPSVDDLPTVDTGSLLEGSSVDALGNSDLQAPASTPTVKGSEDGMNIQWDPNRRKIGTVGLMNAEEEILSCDSPNDESDNSNKPSTKMKPRIILSVKEAREYLSQKHDKRELADQERDRKDLDKEPKVGNLIAGADVLDSATDDEMHVKTYYVMPKGKEVHEPSIFDETSKSIFNIHRNSNQKNSNLDGDVLRSIPLKTADPKDLEKKYEMSDTQRPRTFEEYTDSNCNKTAVPPVSKESWMEKNFQDFEPIVKKIGDGFRENYMVAKEKVKEDLNLSPEISRPGSDEDDSELEWMKDDRLREIVFQVRENELMGRDPFHMMDAEDKHAFFEGLERKVEKESANLLNLHEWVHSRIENLDYGADGISLYDPPEKVIPRWKGPPVDKDPEFLNNVVRHQKASFDEITGVPRPVNQNVQDTIQKSAESPVSDDIPTSSTHHALRNTPQKGPSVNPKTLIESSDGSSRAGKKSGKEYWQHTKRWSREFLELYNEETDPEVKSIMKNMGKDLNRWITEKEIQETADLMTKIPKKKRRYIEKKLDKLKKEMEMFGPQAVVSKYREYGEEEEDYLWWLDLPFVLCIELYTNEDGVQKVGFYSLEMAADLELDPKQYHVIAFEDPGDSKSFCYIVQAHREILGSGSAFVVARPPKDAFREAKANGFGVTVIRKGELHLNVDQTLEEVEEEIAEIGSKVYHDKITRERSVDMGSLMKGVFGSSRSSKRRRSKRMLKKPTTR